MLRRIEGCTARVKGSYIDFYDAEEKFVDMKLACYYYAEMLVSKEGKHHIGTKYVLQHPGEQRFVNDLEGLADRISILDFAEERVRRGELPYIYMRLHAVGNVPPNRAKQGAMIPPKTTTHIDEDEIQEYVLIPRSLEPEEHKELWRYIAKKRFKIEK